MSDEDAHLLASDTERERTIATLRAATAEGRLTYDELPARVQEASAARTRGELARLTADLPAAAPAPPAPAAPPHSLAIFGDLRRSGRWTLPAESRWSSVFGDVRLDLRDAVVGAAEVHVHLHLLFGDIELVVPDAVTVDVRASTIFGDVRLEAGGGAGPRVVLHGGTVFGDVRVLERPRPGLLERLRG